MINFYSSTKNGINVLAADPENNQIWKNNIPYILADKSHFLYPEFGLEIGGATYLVNIPLGMLKDRVNGHDLRDSQTKHKFIMFPYI